MVFLALTDENSPRKLRAFLAEHPVEGLVGLDRDCSILDAFAVHRIPTTVVITPDGNLHRGLAELPDAEQIEDVLGGGGRVPGIFFREN